MLMKCLSVVRKPGLAAVFIALITLVIASCSDKKQTESATSADPLLIPFTVLKTLPHDTEAFTEGLTIEDGKVLESTGQNGNSWVAEVDPGSGAHNKKIILDNQYFGEGMTVLNNKLYYLTYKTKIGFIYDAKTYKQIGEFNYETEGWGLTHDNKNLIRSDGSEKIYYLDTTSLKTVRTLTVVDGNTKIRNINELEFVDGFLYANVYETPVIVKIDPETGKIVGKINFSSQVDEVERMYPNAAELNGIAYDKNSKAFLITGKFWPRSYLIRLQ